MRKLKREKNTESESMSQSQKILKAAVKCLSIKGYANVSLRDVADEAGVVLSQLSYYYKNKEGLFTEVIKDLTRQYLAEIEEALKKGESGSERISNLILYFKEMSKKNFELFKLLFDLTNMSLWSSAFSEHLSNLFNNVADLIEKYVINSFSAKDKFKGYSPKAFARMILGTLFGTSIQMVLDQKADGLDDSLSALKLLFE